MERVESAPSIANKNVSLVGVRANLPKILGLVALVGLAISIGWIVFSWLKPKEKPFVLNGQQVQLSKDVVAEINGYERRETEGEILKYYIKADKAIVFADNHQELDNAAVQVYDQTGENFDKITANHTVFVPREGNSKLFDAQFTGNVNLESRDGLRVKTELISYNRETEIATADDLIEFGKDNITGKSFGAVVRVREKEIELLRDVEVNTTSDETNPQSGRFAAGYAKLNEKSGGEQSIYAKQDVVVNLIPRGNQANLKQPTDIRADELTAYLIEKRIRKIDLEGNTEIFAKPTASNGEFIKISASRTIALFDQELLNATANGNVQIETNRNGKPSKISAQNAVYDKPTDTFDLKNEVEIVTVQENQPTVIRSTEANYQQTTGKIFLKNGAEIVKGDDLVKGDNITAQLFPNKKLQYSQVTGNAFLRQVKPDGTTEVRGNEIVATFGENDNAQNAVVRQNAYLKQVTPEKTTEITGNELTANFHPNGQPSNAVVKGNGYLKQIAQQKTTEIKGNELNADFNINGQPTNMTAKGNGYLKQVAADKTSEVSGNELNAIFDGAGLLQNAASAGDSRAVLVPTQAQDYSRATMTAARAIRLGYVNGILNQMITDGRTTIKFDAPRGDPNGANKTVTANEVKSKFGANGKDLSQVEAVGNAELMVEPLLASAENYRTTVTAPRFDCDFYESGNIAKNCTASIKAKAVRVPTVVKQGRGTQTILGDRLNAIFNQQTQQIQQFDAIGNAKFTELDRNGLANQMTYTATDEVVRLRGGEPTIFDSRARAKALEIDWDTKNSKSFYREKVGTTYYSQKQMNGATPFTKVNKPVYLTADSAQFDHNREVGIYTGNARAWQENNYVRAEELVIYHRESRFEGAGKVQSLLYNATRRENGKISNQPVFAASDKVNYSNKENHIQYTGNVDIRQSTDRITSGVADIYLNENNDMKQTVAQQNVVITQPNRRAAGDWVQYTSADEIAILRGNPATANDAQTGSTEGAQITISMRDNKMVNQGSTKPGGTGRTRTVYKVKN